MLSGARVLVLEEEVLIAMEVQRLLGLANVSHGEIVHSIEELEAIEDRWTEFDAALLEVNARGQTSIGVAKRIAERGVPLLFGTAQEEMRDGIAEFPGVPVLIKPYEGRILRKREGGVRSDAVGLE
jgi:CheY-like chemotaxis protein